MPAARRTVSLHLPTWPTDRLRREWGADAPAPEVPLVTAAVVGPQRTIIAADASARSVGLAAGQPVARAKVLVPDLVVVESEPERDGWALGKLAEWALRRYSPVVAVDGEDGLRIDASGCVHLFGSERDMLADMVRRLARSGTAASAAMASCHGAAHGLARFGGVTVLPIDPRDERGSISALPIAALRLEVRILSRLAKLGFETVGQLASTARAPLVRRFGPEVVERLDHAFGTRSEPFEPIVVPDMPSASLSFVEPIGTAEQLGFVISELAGHLAEALVPGDLGARRLDLVFHRVDAERQMVRVGTAAASRDPAHFRRLLLQRLDTVDPGLGVEIMTLSAPVTEPLRPTQVATSFAGERQRPPLSSLVDILSNRLGEASVFRVQPVESEVPERSVERVAALAPPCGMSWPAEWPRPVRMLTPPEPVETTALLPDNPPVMFTWRGRRHRILRADGPERVFGEWWRREREALAVRDYFTVEDEEGGRYWLYRSGDGLDPETGSLRWYMHGIFG